MGTYTVPPVEVVVDMVKEYDRRIGLRMLYGKYNIPKSERDKYRELWSRFYDMLPDAFEKETVDASEERETTEDDGDSSPSTGQAVSQEPESPEDVEEKTA